ncbi:MAG: insulinase family protein [Myxococcales bacterium]|nr:insulinase family protein [Myxococcales bacterium]MCB9753867.1 insulinase family protein [Myxococcales bacterium]
MHDSITHDIHQDTSRRRRGHALLAACLGVTLVGACTKTKQDTAPPVQQDTRTEDEKARAAKAEEAARKRAELAALPALPGVKAPAPVKFPEPVITTLDNGLELIVLEDHEVPSVDITLHVKAGEIYSSAEQPTIAKFTAYMLGEGTKKHKKAKLDALIDATGGALGSGAGDERATISASLLAGDAELGLSLIAEQALRPTFPEESFDKVKDMMIQEVASQKSQPFGLALQFGRRVVYGERSAYGRPFPTDAQIKGMTRAQVLAFHETHYVPNNAMLVIAGDITPEQAQKLTKKHFGAWARGADISVPRAEAPARPSKTVVHLIDRPASAQATVMVAVPAPGIGEQGWLEAKALQSVFGGGLSARLNQVLREQLGLTYGAAAFHSHGFDGGVFFAGGGTKTKSAGEFAQALIDVLQQPGEEGIEAKELARVLSKISGQFALEVEGVDTVAAKTVTQRLYGLPDGFWERYRADVESVTPAQIKASTRQLFVDQPVQIVAIGKAKKIRESLSQFGEVIVYDTQLQRVSQ